MKINKKIEERFAATLPKFQKVLSAAKDRDLNESDTVLIITDILADVFGYDKYVEITSELAIRGTYCDLAIKINDKIQYLIECKAIGTDLKDVHLRQAIGYGSNKGVQWIILTNGIEWQIYRIRFEQPIACDLVLKFNLLNALIKCEKSLCELYLVTKEGVEKNARDDVYEKIKCINRFVVGALMLNEPVISTIKKELKKLADGIKVDDSEIYNIIKDGILRRDLLEGEESCAAAKKVGTLYKNLAKKTSKKIESVKPIITSEKTPELNTEPDINANTDINTISQ